MLVIAVVLFITAKVFHVFSFYNPRVKSHIDRLPFLCRILGVDFKSYLPPASTERRL